MPRCCPRFGPIIDWALFYIGYVLLVMPITELVVYLLKILMDVELVHYPRFTGWILLGPLLTFFPCYLIVFYVSYRKHRAKPLFTPKWKTGEPFDEDDVLCTICYDLIVEPRTLRCQHSFCKVCINQSLPQTRRCPSCQQWVYWSRRNRKFNEKVLQWVKEQRREDEYAQVVQIKKEVLPVKVGCITMFHPFLFPFLEDPLPERFRLFDRHRRARAVVVELAAPRPQESLVVQVVDESEGAAMVETSFTEDPPLIQPATRSVESLNDVV